MRGLGFVLGIPYSLPSIDASLSYSIAGKCGAQV